MSSDILVARRGGTAVEHLTHYTKIKGLNPTIGYGRDKKWHKNVKLLQKNKLTKTLAY